MLSTHLLPPLGSGQLLSRLLGIRMRLPLHRLSLRHPPLGLPQLPLALADLRRMRKATRVSAAASALLPKHTYKHSWMMGKKPCTTRWLTSRTRPGRQMHSRRDQEESLPHHSSPTCWLTSRTRRGRRRPGGGGRLICVWPRR